MAPSLGAFALFFLITLTPRSMMKDWPSMFVVWNVGQGQWLTYIDRNSCDHFDMGGEHSPLAPVIDFCQHLKNRLWLSHGDWDHLSFVGKSGLPDLCLATHPPKLRSTRKERLLKHLRRCEAETPQWLTMVWQPPLDIKSTNDSSLVLRVGSVLIPGDSTSRQEKFWARNSTLKNVRLLILGHHGSRTSTSGFLLKQMPELTQAIGSSRRSRYGHPHYEVEQRLRQARVPLLTTEDWGSVRF